MEAVRRLRSQSTVQPTSISTDAFYSANSPPDASVRRQSRRSMPISTTSAVGSGANTPSAKSRTSTPTADTAHHRRSLRSQSTSRPQAAASLSPVREPQTPSPEPDDRRRSLRSQSAARPATATPTTTSTTQLNPVKNEDIGHSSVKKNNLNQYDAERYLAAKLRAKTESPQKRKKRRSSRFSTRKKSRGSTVPGDTPRRDQIGAEEEELEEIRDDEDDDEDRSSPSGSLVQSDLPPEIVEAFNATHRYVTEDEMDMSDDEKVYAEGYGTLMDTEQSEGEEDIIGIEGNEHLEQHDREERQDDDATIPDIDIPEGEIEDNEENNEEVEDKDIDVPQEEEKQEEAVVEGGQEGEDITKDPIDNSPEAPEDEDRPLVSRDENLLEASEEGSLSSENTNRLGRGSTKEDIETLQDGTANVEDDALVGDDSLADESFHRRRPHRQRKPTKFFDESYVAPSEPPSRRVSLVPRPQTPANPNAQNHDIPTQTISPNTPRKSTRKSLIVTLKTGKTQQQQPTQKLAFKLTAPQHWNSSRVGRASTYTATETKLLFDFSQDEWDELRQSARKFYEDNPRLLKEHIGNTTQDNEAFLRELNENEGTIDRGTWAVKVFPHLGTDATGKEGGGEFLLYHSFRYMRRMVKKGQRGGSSNKGRGSQTQEDSMIEDRSTQEADNDHDKEDDDARSNIEEDVPETQMEIPDSQEEQDNDLSSHFQVSVAESYLEDQDDVHTGPSLASIQLSARISDLNNEVSDLRDLYDTERGSRLSLKAELSTERDRRVSLESQLSAEREANRKREEQFTKSLQDIQSFFSTQLAEERDRQKEANQLLAFRLRNVYDELSEELKTEKRKRIEAEEKMFEMIDSREYLSGGSGQKMLEDVDKAMQGLEAIKGILSPGVLGKRTRDGELIRAPSAALEGLQTPASSGLNGTIRPRLTNGADVEVDIEEVDDETTMVVRDDVTMVEGETAPNLSKQLETSTLHPKGLKPTERVGLIIQQNGTAIPIHPSHSPRRIRPYSPMIDRRFSPPNNSPTNAQVALARLLKEKKRVSFREEPEVKVIESSVAPSNKTNTPRSPVAKKSSSMTESSPQTPKSGKSPGLKEFLPRDYHRYYGPSSDLGMDTPGRVENKDDEGSMNRNAGFERDKQFSEVGEKEPDEGEYAETLIAQQRGNSIGRRNGIFPNGLRNTNEKSPSPILEKVVKQTTPPTTNANSTVGVNGSLAKVKKPNVGISTGTIVKNTGDGYSVSDLQAHMRGTYNMYKRACDLVEKNSSRGVSESSEKLSDAAPNASSFSAKVSNSNLVNGSNNSSEIRRRMGNKFQNGYVAPATTTGGQPPPITSDDSNGSSSEGGKVIHTGNFFKLTATPDSDNDDDDETNNEDFRDIYRIREASGATNHIGHNSIIRGLPRRVD